MGWFSRDKTPKPEPDYAGAQRQRTARALNQAEAELVQMEQGIPHLQERVGQGHLSAAAIAARGAGFSSSVTRPLEKAQKLREPARIDEVCDAELPLRGQDRIEKAKSLTAEAGSYAILELQEKVAKAQSLRSQLQEQ